MLSAGIAMVYYKIGKETISHGKNTLSGFRGRQLCFLKCSFIDLDLLL